MSESSTYFEVLARDWRVELDWVQDSGGNRASKSVNIANLETIGFDSAMKEADITTFENAGNDAHVVASRSRMLKLNGYYAEDLAGKSVEPGLQGLVELSESTGVASLGHFTLTSPAGKTRSFLASATFDTLGGGKDDPTKWACTLKVSGGVEYA